MRNFKFFTIVVFFTVSFLFYSAYGAGNDPDTYVYANYGTVRSLDPAVAYDDASGQRLQNIYETLIFFEGSHTDKFRPVIATEVPTVDNGGISKDGKTYSFTIRKGVKFHEGGTLTPEDVAYSLKRNMICDPDGGPMWMLLEALTGQGGTRDKEGKIIPGIFEEIDKSIEVKGDKVIFHLPNPYPPLLGILAYTASSVIDKDWAIENGCWDGNLENAAKFNNPDPGYEPLQKITNGTGPYKMKSWIQNNVFEFERFEGYWGEKPQIKTARVKNVTEWSTRKLMLQNGDADRVAVDLQYYPEVKNMKGIKIYEVPQLSLTCAMFCQKVNPTGNESIGSGKLDGEGIPPDFFSDINVRKAFLHCFDAKTYKEDVFNNLMEVPSSPNITGLPYHKDVPTYEYNMRKAKDYMKKAWNGEVWKKGFKMVITHNTGNEQREAAAHMLAENMMSLNKKFQIEVQNVDWKDYLVKYRQYLYPIYIIGWVADYADPHNFMYTFMHSQGVYGKYMAYSNAEVDKLCDQGIKTVDPKEREKIYHKLQQMFYEEAIAVPLSQPKAIWVYRESVKGFTPNAMFSPGSDFIYKLRKD